MDKNICTYIYAYKNSIITCFDKPLTPYLVSRNMGLGDIYYLLTMTNIDKTIHNELELIENRCKELECRIITINKHG